MVSITSEYIFFVTAIIYMCLLALLPGIIACFGKKKLPSVFAGRRGSATAVVIIIVLMAFHLFWPSILESNTKRQIRWLRESISSGTRFEVTLPPATVESIYELYETSQLRRYLSNEENEERQEAIEQLRKFEFTDRELRRQLSLELWTTNFQRRSLLARCPGKFGRCGPDTVVRIYRGEEQTCEFRMISPRSLRIGLLGRYKLSKDILKEIAQLDRRPLAVRLRCVRNLRRLREALITYKPDKEAQFRGRNHIVQYPEPNQWCEELLGRYNEDAFICEGAGEGKCHYAMNPDCGPDSPADTVLLFETRSGWNQHGGAEILVTDHHSPPGCNVLFNDSTIRFVKPEDIGELKW